MANPIRELFSSLFTEVTPRLDKLDSVNLAAAVLFVEAMQADQRSQRVERKAVEQGLQGLLGISPQEATVLRDKAEEKMRDLVSMHEFVQVLNHEFTDHQKEQLLEGLWRVAHADDVLDKYEEHLIRRVSELLYIGHSAFIRSKLKVMKDG